MRNTLALLATATPLAFGMASLADVVDADLVCFSLMNGETGVLETAGFTLASNASSTSAFGPGGFAVDESGLPVGVVTRNGPRTSQVGASTPDNATPADIDALLAANFAGTWTATLDGSTYSGTLPSNLITAPSARSYARLTADSMAQLFAYTGQGDLELFIESPLATAVRLAVYNETTHEILMLTTISAGGQSATITDSMANSIGFDPAGFLLFTESASSSMLTWALQDSGDPSEGITVEYWEMQATGYWFVPSPGAISMIGLAGLLVRRRPN